MFSSRALLAGLLTLTLVLFSAKPADAVLALVQECGPTSGTNTSPTVTCGAAPTNGDFLVGILAYAGATATLATPSSPTWTVIQKRQQQADCDSIAAYWVNVAGGSPGATITWTTKLSVSTPWTLFVFELSGGAATPLDQATGSAQCSNATGMLHPTNTATVNGPFIIAAGVATSSSATFCTVGNGINFIDYVFAAGPCTGAVHNSAAFNTSDWYGISAQLKSTGGSGVGVSPGWNGSTNVTNAQAIIFDMIPAVPPVSAGGLPMMGCC